MAEKRRCENCGKVMKQQFIGLLHCKCGISWQKGVGYFQRTNDMVFTLERKVTKKSKNSVSTKQVPIIRYNDEWDEGLDAPCIACKGDKLKVNGCNPYYFSTDGKTKYVRIKVGDAGDMYEGSSAITRCEACGAKHGNPHHFRCDCETCPICGNQVLSCKCEFYTTTA